MYLDLKEKKTNNTKTAITHKEDLHRKLKINY